MPLLHHPFVIWLVRSILADTKFTFFKNLGGLARQMSINPAYVEDTDGEHANSELEDSGKLSTRAPRFLVLIFDRQNDRESI